MSRGLICFRRNLVTTVKEYLKLTVYVAICIDTLLGLQCFTNICAVSNTCISRVWILPEYKNNSGRELHPVAHRVKRDIGWYVHIDTLQRCQNSRLIQP